MASNFIRLPITGSAGGSTGGLITNGKGAAIIRVSSTTKQ